MGTLREFLSGMTFDPADLNHPEAVTVVDMVFFKVAVNPLATEKSVRQAIAQHQTESAEGYLNLFDGREHSYIEIGAWAEDQGLALKLMALGSALGMWKLLTPKTVLPMLNLSEEDTLRIARRGLVTIQAEKGKYVGVGW